MVSGSRPRSRAVRLLSLWLAILTVFVSNCPLTLPASAREIIRPASPTPIESEPQPLQYTVTEVATGVDKSDKIVTANASLLAPERAEAILSRLKPFNAPPEQKLILPEDSLIRPAIPGKLVVETFPPAVVATAPRPRQPVNAATAPLTVTHFSPEESVDTVDQIAINFSQPMTALGQVDKLHPEKIVTLTPQPPGEWSWAGTQTLLFTPKDRLPKATHYKVEVPDTTVSVSGNKIDRAYHTSILTPPAQVANFYPRSVNEFDRQSRRPVIIALFNQAIDHKKVLNKTRLLVENQNLAIKEITKDALLGMGDEIKAQIPSSDSKFWLAFSPVNALPLNATTSVEFLSGLPSAEGPRLSDRTDTFTFKTHDLFKLVEKKISGQAGQGMTNPIAFTTFIQPEQNLVEAVTITPAVTDLKKGVQDNRLFLSGNFLPFTTYSVKVNRNLKDKFGQTLSDENVAEIKTGALSRSIGPDKFFKTYSSDRSPRYIAWVQGAQTAKVDIRHVEPTDFINFKSQRYERDRDEYGKLISSKTYEIGNNGRQLDIDLKPFLKKRTGHLAVRVDLLPVEPNHPHFSKSWIQTTDIGLDAQLSKKMEVLVTDLSSAKPLSGVRLKFIGKEEEVLSNEFGQASLTIPEKQNTFLIAAKDSDLAILFRGEYLAWHPNYTPDSSRWYTVTDRNLYKPGETVTVKGWLRDLSFGSTGALEFKNGVATKIWYQLTDATGNPSVKGEGTTDEHGGFSFTLPLPSKLPLGQAIIWISTVSPENHFKIDGSVLITEARIPRHFIQEDQAKGKSTYLSISVQEFRQPEFEMSVAAGPKTPLIFGDSTTLTSTAKYLVGGPLADAPVNWSVNPSGASFRPPSWPDYSFNQYHRTYQGNYRKTSDWNRTVTGHSDSKGNDTIKLDFVTPPSPVPMNFQCQATVVDVNRQTWSASHSLLVHPAELYVGIKLDKPRYETGEPVTLNVVAVDLDGKLQAGTKVSLDVIERNNDGAERIDTQHLVIGAQPAEVRLSPAPSTTSVSLVAHLKDCKGRENIGAHAFSIEQPVKQLVTDLAGLKEIKLTADKAEYKPGDIATIRIESPFAPASGLAVITRNAIVSNKPLQIAAGVSTIEIPISEDYYPSVKVGVLLNADSTTFGSGSIVLKVPPHARQLKVSAAAGKAEIAPGKKNTVNVTVTDDQSRPVRNSQVAVAVVDESILALTGYKWQDPLDFFYTTSLPPDYNSRSREYVVLKAGQDATDQAGINRFGFDNMYGRTPRYNSLVLPVRPTRIVAGRIAESNGPGHGFKYLGSLGSIDRYTFFGNSQSGPRDMNLFQVEPTVLDERHYTSGRAERHQAKSSGGNQQQQIYLRENFTPLAVFKAALTTDETGKASAEFTMPDNVTRYRVMALAVADSNRFGSGESTITAKMPLMIKPSPPRFLQLADSFELPVVVQNQSDKPMVVDVAIRAQNAKITQSAKQVTVPANDRVEVRFPTVASNFGTAKFQCAAVAGSVTDAAEFGLPVLVPASSEAFAAYGVVDEGMAVQKLDTPKDVFEKLGGLSIETSSTAVQSLTDAYIYLRDYQFNCSEQISSRLIAMLSLQNTLTAFGILKGDEEALYKQTIKSDIDTLQKRQGDEGGFGLWSKDDTREWPFVSIQVVRALHLAKEKDYAVTQDVLDKGLVYLKNIETLLPAYYGESRRLSILTRALNVRHLAGDNDAKAGKALFERFLLLPTDRHKPVTTDQRLPADRLRDFMTIETAAWLLVVLDKDNTYELEAKQLRSFIHGQIKQTASTASVNENSGYGYGDWFYCMFASPRRTDAAVLEALMEDDKQSDLIPKFVKGLLAHRKNGAWDGTQENGYILQTLDKYFNIYEKQEPNFTAQTWLGNTLLANHKFAGRTTERKLSKIPMSYLLTHPASDILINKEGKGRLYYRLALDYVPKNMNLKPIDQGFSVTRTYEPVDAESDVTKDGDGVWHFKSGARVKVKVHFKNIGPRYHVAMSDPIPAGAEPINSALLGNQEPSPVRAWSNPNERLPDQPYISRWWRNWYEHNNLRDHQAEAFASLLMAGEHNFDYTIQATTPGRYTVPPTRVEEMYQSETFGRCQTETVVIN